MTVFPVFYLGWRVEMNCFLQSGMTTKYKVNHSTVWKKNAFRFLYDVNWPQKISDTYEDKFFQGNIPGNILRFIFLILLCLKICK